MLENVYCSLNAIPVINRRLNSFTYKMKEFIDIIPIKTESLFLDLKSITNTSGKAYKLLSKNASSSEKGTFIVRTDNIGKLDHRKAKEYLKHLIELLKDESASFSFFNNDFLYKNLSTLNQYRRSLLSRDRIVTKEDVKALCHELYSSKISDVKVSKGYTTDLALKKGLLQCINIELTPNKKVSTEAKEWEALNNNLLLYLETHSINVFPYKIMITS